MTIDLKATGAIPAGVRKSLALPYSVRLYGAVADGSTDDASSIQAAINAAGAAGGGVVYFPPGDYKLTAATTAGALKWHLEVVDDNITLDFAPGARLVSTVADCSILAIGGMGKASGFSGWASGEYADVTAKVIDPATAGDVSVTCDTAADANSFAAGDYVWIRTGQTLASGTSEPDAEINQVVSVNGGTGVVTLRWPLVKDYAQEYFISGTSGLTSTAVTANPAVLGIAKVTDRTLTGITIRGMGYDCDNWHPLLGGQLVDYRLENCVGVGDGCGLMSQGNYRFAAFLNNRIHAKTAGATTYAFTTAVGCSDVEIAGNVVTGERTVFMHIHEGSANVDLHHNTMRCHPSGSDENLVSVRARAYNVTVRDNVLHGGGNGNAVYVDETCVGGGSIRGNKITTDASNAIYVDPTVQTAWRVAQNDANAFVLAENETGPPVSGVVYPVAGEYATPTRRASTTLAPGQNNCTWTWLPLGQNATIDRIGIEVTTGVAASTVRLGLYAPGANGKPGALIVDAGTADCTSTGLVEKTISELVTVPGVWLCSVRQGAGAPTLRALATSHDARYTRSTGTVVTQFDLNCWSGTVSGALPATPPTIIGDVNPAMVVVRFA